MTSNLPLFFPLSESVFKRRRGWKVGKRDLTGKDEYHEETTLEMNQGKVLDQDQDDFVEEPTFRSAEADPGIFGGKICFPFGCINKGN